MIRPVYGPPFNDGKALWDASYYDLLPVDPNPDHATLKWIDGTSSGFAVKDMPPASAMMEVYLETN